VGFFTNKPEEAVIAAQVLIPDWSVVGKARPPVLGVPEGPFLEKPDAPARSQFRSVLAKLSSGGYSLCQLPLFDDLEDISARHQLIVAAEAARVHSEWFSRYADRYHPRTADLIRRGQRIGDTEVMQSISEMGVWRARLAEIMEREGIDIWLSPAALGTAPLGLDSTGDPIMNLPWTQAGFPALTLPSGEDAAGLPYGLQLVGRSSADESLMAWAGEIDLCLRQEK
jgi:Asp-tRNA(Asn)/Glu-tRNA(Gln) amidotransferase A subunit family amidase